MGEHIPDFIPNLIGGQDVPAADGATYAKLSPVTGAQLALLARSGKTDVAKAVDAARQAAPAWSAMPAVARGLQLHAVVRKLQDSTEALAQVVALETGKSVKDARGEVGAVVQIGLFYASEGQRLYGRTTTSGVPGRQVMHVRQPIGVAGLIVAANTPLANVAWKVFPALVCGNTAVLKAPEDTPATAWLFGRLAREAGLPPGVLNIVHGLGAEAGQPLAEHADVGVLSFTGSTRVGRVLQEIAGRRLARVSLELGGKNPFVVCDDADLDKAVHWAVLSAFSNAGQRCAAASRIIVMRGVLAEFKSRLLAKTKTLRVGPGDGDDFGPVINSRQMNRILEAIAAAQAKGATVLVGGHRLTTPELAPGCFIAPTLLENVPANATAACEELFGPVATLQSADSFEQAVQLANDTPYGLTASIHTRDFNRAMAFCNRVQSGVVTVNAGTYGSEPHLPFGGRGESGNGTREPGTEALDIYTHLKNIYLNVDAAAT